MEEYTTYGYQIMKKLRDTLLQYKKHHHLTNMEMSIKCDISLSEYDKIMNIKQHGKHGCTADTLYKIFHNLNIDANDIFKF